MIAARGERGMLVDRVADREPPPLQNLPKLVSAVQAGRFCSSADDNLPSSRRGGKFGSFHGSRPGPWADGSIRHEWEHVFEYRWVGGFRCAAYLG
jgi:hypothetical protein